jgi:hypothetical protein
MGKSKVEDIIENLKKMNVDDILTFMVQTMGTKQLRQCINSIVDKKTPLQIEEIQMVSESSKKSVRSSGSESSQESVRSSGSESSQESVRSSDGENKKVRGPEEFCKKSEFKQLQLEEVPVKGDGNCQFRAIAVLLNMEEEKWREVKKELLDHFNENTLDYRDIFVDEDIFKNTKKTLMTDGEWGEEPTIRVAERCYGIQIDIWNEKTGSLLIGTRSEHPFLDKHTILYNGYSHYNASNDPVNSNNMKDMNRKLKSENKNIRVIAEYKKDGKKRYFCITYKRSIWKIKEVKTDSDSEPIKKYLINDKTIVNSDVIDGPYVEPTEDEIKSALEKVKNVSVNQTSQSFGKGMVSAKGNKFLESTQKYAALKNMYIVGARLVKPRKYMFLTYRFDVAKKKWVSAKNGKLLGRWLSVRQIKNMKAYKGKVSKECIKSFMSLNYLYPNMNNKNDILLKPLKPRYFGVVKK